jgi:membrane-bound metal-dependent hydrolase YbcI (DUF457 family)
MGRFSWYDGFVVAVLVGLFVPFDRTANVYLSAHYGLGGSLVALLLTCFFGFWVGLFLWRGLPWLANSLRRRSVL